MKLFVIDTCLPFTGYNEKVFFFSFFKCQQLIYTVLTKFS